MGSMHFTDAMLQEQSSYITDEWSFFLFQDILENEDVKLDHMFIASLVSDIVKVR